MVTLGQEGSQDLSAQWGEWDMSGICPDFPWRGFGRNFPNIGENLGVGWVAIPPALPSVTCTAKVGADHQAPPRLPTAGAVTPEELC